MILSIEAKDFTPQMREACRYLLRAGWLDVEAGNEGSVDGKLLITTEHFLEAAVPDTQRLAET